MRLLFRILLIGLFCIGISVSALASEGIVITPSVQVIEEEAFCGDYSVKTLVLNEKIESIGKRAFADCRNLVEIYCFSNTVQIDESAFSEDEKDRIVSVYNINEDNPQYGTESGPDSVDKVFFLSYSEMMQYMPTSASRKVTMTAMAVRESGDNIGKYWWLRTSGAHQWFAMHIQGSDGNISYYGSDVGHDNVGYRPCIRIRVGG